MSGRGLDVGALARAYRQSVVRYDRDAAGGLLLHNGSGIALAVIDACPELTWCLDLTGLRGAPPYELCAFAHGASRVGLVAGALTFYADDVRPVATLLGQLYEPGLVPVLTTSARLPAVYKVAGFEPFTAAVCVAARARRTPRPAATAATAAPVPGPG